MLFDLECFVFFEYFPRLCQGVRDYTKPKYDELMFFL